MSSQKSLFVVTTIVEAITGLALAFRPATTLWLFFGADTVSFESLAICRLCGAALVAIALSCWCARSGSLDRASCGGLWGMLVYNLGAVAVLGLVGIGGQSVGLALWPGVVAHLALTAWSVNYLFNKQLST